MKLIKKKRYPIYALQSIRIFLIAVGLFSFSYGRAQAITEVITDFGGYWKSGSSSINPIKPNNSHNLLAFSFNGLRYSTGANDASLSLHGEVYMAEDFRALPVRSLTGTINGNTKIGLGASYDGIPNGASNPPPENNIQKYLTDGIKGLDIGTGSANLPSGPIIFGITKLEINSIGDGVPDILVTQFADPSGSTDRYEFTDSAGNRVGNYVNISFSHISPVGNWTADFYEASKNPMTLTSGYTRTDRPLRLWAADFSDFGIEQGDLSRIANFKITLNGNSDVAFVAYNFNTFNIGLPLKLVDFSGKEHDNQTDLSWTTNQESNGVVYVLEKSDDGISFQAIDSVEAKAVTFGESRYHYTDQEKGPGKRYYRIKIKNPGDIIQYSKVLSFISPVENTSLHFYPNPTKDHLFIFHGKSMPGDKVEILNMQGRIVLQKKLTDGSDETRLDIAGIRPGMYIIRIQNGTLKQSAVLMIGL